MPRPTRVLSMPPSMDTKRGQGVRQHSPPGGTVPRNVLFQSFCPGSEFAPPTGATALYAHQVSNHSHKNTGDKRRQYVPEKVQHGQTSFRRTAPRIFYHAHGPARNRSFFTPCCAGPARVFLFFALPGDGGRMESGGVAVKSHSPE